MCRRLAFFFGGHKSIRPCCVIAGLVLVCFSSASGRPFWIEDPKSDDSIYIYSVGVAHRQASVQEAERAAHRDALLRILRTHRSDITDPDLWPMQNVEAVPGCKYHEETPEGHSFWIQIKWPQHERSNLVEKVAQAEVQEKQLSQARTLVTQGKTTDSRAMLMKLLKQQVEEPSPVLSSIEIQFQVARSWHVENRPIEARQWYERLLAEAPDDPLAREASKMLSELPPPGRLWPLHARFAGGPVGLVMVKSEGGDWEPYREMRRGFSQAFRDAGIDTHDWGRKLDADDLQDVVEDSFEDSDLDALEQAPIGLLLAIETDPSKVGTTKMVFGTAVPIMDSRVRVVAYDVASNDKLYEAGFAAMRGDRSLATFSEHIIHTVIHDYLLPHCPGVKRTMTERMTY